MMESVMRFTGICVLVMVCGVANAEVYRWVDENGKVHFGDRPPANSNARALDMPESDSSQTPSVSDQERKERQKRLVEALEEERRIKEQKKQEEEARAAKREAYCRRLLAKVKDSERINLYYRYNEKGERVYMSDAEADRYRSELQSTFNARCGNG